MVLLGSLEGIFGGNSCSIVARLFPTCQKGAVGFNGGTVCTSGHAVIQQGDWGRVVDKVSIQCLVAFCTMGNYYAANRAVVQSMKQVASNHARKGIRPRSVLKLNFISVMISYLQGCSYAGARSQFADNMAVLETDD